MEKIRNLSLRKSIILYLSVSLVPCIFLALWVGFIAERYQQDIWFQYMDQEEYFKKAELGETLPEIIRISDSLMSKRDTELSNICDILASWPILLFPLAGFVLAVLLFYRNKIRKPLIILSEASDRISRNELDFKVDYVNHDELGQLCGNFEKMRSQLFENNKMLWGMVEQEKALRAAIAHDIRSPLAVLKGYQEMLLEFLPEDKLDQEKLKEILEAGLGQIDRIHEFMETMRKLSALEERKVCRRSGAVRELAGELAHTTAVLAGQAGREYSFAAPDIGELLVDSSVVYEVYENLLSNALRYAKDKVEITVQVKENCLQLELRDDGCGFSKDADLLTSAYYHANPMDDLNHFGLGLYICRIYCEKHGGRLLLGNWSGGAYAAAQFGFTEENAHNCFTAK